MSRVVVRGSHSHGSRIMTITTKYFFRTALRRSVGFRLAKPIPRRRMTRRTNRSDRKPSRGFSRVRATTTSRRDRTKRRRTTIYLSQTSRNVFLGKMATSSSRNGMRIGRSVNRRMTSVRLWRTFYWVFLVANTSRSPPKEKF